MNNKGGKKVEPALSADMIQSWRDKIGQVHSASPLLPSQERGLFSRFSSLHRMLNSQPRRIRRRLSRKTRLSLTDIAFMLAMGISLPAAAQTILVNTDVVAVNNNGLCSLIEAINNANGDRVIHSDCPAGSGADTIVLQNGETYTILRSVNSKQGQGLPPIFSEMTIEGNNSTINVSAVPVDVVFNVTPKGNLTLKDATISGDDGSGTGTDTPRVHNTGKIQLNNVNILLNPDRVSGITNAASGTFTADGLDVNCGGICDHYSFDYTGHGIVNYGSMALTNTKIRNLAFGWDYATNTFVGGTINNSGILSLNNVLIENNGTWGGNAGVFNKGSITGTNVTIRDNGAFGGVCGLLSEPDSSLILQDSHIGSGASYYGCVDFWSRGSSRIERTVITSGASNSGQMEMIDSTVSGHFGSGGESASLTMEGVTIASGTPIYISNLAVIRNSTITGTWNRYCDNHGCDFPPFALNITGDITINNSTIGGNICYFSYYSVSDDYPAVSGILFDGNVSLSNSIIVASTRLDDDKSIPPFYGVLVNRGILNSKNNLFGDDRYTNAEAFLGFTPDSTDVVATSDGTQPTAFADIIQVWAEPYEDKIVPKLEDNGGPTKTVALVDGSPAIDAGGSNCEPTDQRGVTRPQGTACDIGAYEVFNDSPPPVTEPGVAETGVASANHNWKAIAVDDMPTQPVVIAGPPTFKGGDPGVVRIQNVGSVGFDIRFQEWDYRDGWHAVEQISYLVAQKGRHEMPDGSIWEAGTFNHSGTPDWNAQSFSDSFPGTPHLFLTIQTENDTQAVTARARNVTTSGFEVGFFEQESLMDGHGVEAVGYLAIYSSSDAGSIDIDGAPVSYDLSQTGINHNWTSVLGKQMKVEEEKSKDTETWHAFENVDALNLGGALFGQIVTSNGGDPAALRQK